MIAFRCHSSTTRYRQKNRRDIKANNTTESSILSTATAQTNLTEAEDEAALSETSLSVIPQTEIQVNNAQQEVEALMGNNNIPESVRRPLLANRPNSIRFSYINDVRRTQIKDNNSLSLDVIEKVTNRSRGLVNRDMSKRMPTSSYFTEQVSTACQTDCEKIVNITDAMGHSFKHRHVFDLNNKTLQLEQSLVKLTLAERDVNAQIIECYASTFHNIYEVYGLLNDLLTANESIASPVISYFCPDISSLKEFACVSTERTFLGKDFHVWSIVKDATGKPFRVEIFPKNALSPTDENVVAYYEEYQPGFIKIFLKRFCTFVCTECGDWDGNYQLDATVYTEEIGPCVKVKLYLVDPLYQLQDYRKVGQACSCAIASFFMQ